MSTGARDDRTRSLTGVFRAPTRARALDAGRFAGAVHAVDRSLAGAGERLDQPPPDLAAAILATAAEHGHKSARMLARFAELEESSLLWTRTGEEEFRLGKLDGPWRYDDSDGARRTGIHQVRPARWLPEPFDAGSTPPAVVETFSRGGRNLQRINDPEVESQSRDLWHGC